MTATIRIHAIDWLIDWSTIFYKIQMSIVFFITETDPIEVSDWLQKINVNKATDIYGILSKPVKMTAWKLKDNLVLIFNYSID